ncbi:hypothetical protein HZC35_03385 [Candidatus Saganbacteria bacterium]|nr:hypothetical protein [Candidatus Saganbacteria bacterium]
MMKGKIGLALLGLIILLGVLGLVGGCGARIVDVVTYSDPNWTPEGKIYAKKVVARYVDEWQGLWLGGMKQIKESETTSYQIMDIDGNNEQALSYPYYPYYSPKGTYVCYVDTTSTFHIIRRSDNTQLYSFQPTTEAISEIDWGPNEDKLVFLKAQRYYSGHLGVVDITGANLFDILAEAASPTWKYNAKVAFENGTLGNLTFLDVSSQTLETTSINYGNIGANLQYYNSGDYLFAADREKFYKISVADKSIIQNSTHNLLASNPNIALAEMRLSPNSQNIVGGMAEEGGIWIINVDGSGFNKIR